MQLYSKNPVILVLSTVLVAFSSPARAQTSSCPLEPIQVKDVASQLAIDFANLSSKSVATYQFGLTFFDNAGKARTFPQFLAGNTQMPGHAHRLAVWQSRLAQQFLLPYAQVYLKNVVFTDGTSWSDDGSHACSVISVQE